MRKWTWLALFAGVLTLAGVSYAADSSMPPSREKRRAPGKPSPVRPGPREEPSRLPSYKHVIVQPADFVPRSHHSSMSEVTTNLDASLLWMTGESTGTGGFDNRTHSNAFAPVDLPDGAVVAELDCYATDLAQSGDFNVSVSLARVGLPDDSRTRTLATAKHRSAGQQASIHFANGVASAEPVDNSKEYYVLRLSMAQIGSANTTAFGIKGCRVAYR